MKAFVTVFLSVPSNVQRPAVLTVHLTVTKKAEPGCAGSPGSSSPRLRCPSWRGASDSSATCPPRRESTWPTSSNSPPHRSKSGFRTGGTNANAKGRTSLWSWRGIHLHRGGWRCRCWCTTGSCAAQVHIQYRIMWLSDIITPCLDTETAACMAAVITAFLLQQVCQITSWLI